MAEYRIKGPNSEDINLSLYTNIIITSKKKGKIPTITNDDFITHLGKYGVISGTNDCEQDEELASQMDAPIDNTIKLAES